MINLIIYFVLFIVISNLLFPLVKNKLMFFPTVVSQAVKCTNKQVQEINITNFKTLNDVNCLFYYSNNKSKKVVLVCHGNAGNIYHREFFYDMFKDYNVVLFDYRGFGKSVGSTTSEGACEDAYTVWRYLISLYDCDDIIIYGESFGGYVATWLASKTKPYCLITHAAPTSAKDVASIVLKSLCIIHPDELETKKYIKEVPCPILLIHGKMDEVVPHEHGLKLWNLINKNNKNNKFVSFDCFHNIPKDNKQYCDTINLFIDTINLFIYQ